MMVRTVVRRNQKTVGPFDSVDSIEPLLLLHGYLAVRDGPRFLGILVPGDVVRYRHDLVVDCLSPKKAVSEDDDIDTALNVMKAERQGVLPVLDGEGEYAGSVSLVDILSELHAMRQKPIETTIVNYVGPVEIEDAKRRFIAELDHSINNPLQVIMSSIDMIKDSKGEDETRILLESISTCAKSIGSVVSGLQTEYFE